MPDLRSAPSRAWRREQRACRPQRPQRRALRAWEPGPPGRPRGRQALAQDVASRSVARPPVQESQRASGRRQEPGSLAREALSEPVPESAQDGVVPRAPEAASDDEPGPALGSMEAQALGRERWQQEQRQQEQRQQWQQEQWQQEQRRQRERQAQQAQQLQRPVRQPAGVAAWAEPSTAHEPPGRPAPRCRSPPRGCARRLPPGAARWTSPLRRSAGGGASPGRPNAVPHRPRPGTPRRPAPRARPALPAARPPRRPGPHRARSAGPPRRLAPPGGPARACRRPPTGPRDGSHQSRAAHRRGPAGPTPAYRRWPPRAPRCRPGRRRRRPAASPAAIG